ncbi:hypothetical protein [Calycomorphotria hydatis]|uniref:hypothetical protein n=1 Tax=Calycomorphotria hydatis TaxID=2528027 RepID=UPI0011A8FCDD|nr:hypothetical protein [Calycomorphotria hydatis]
MPPNPRISSDHFLQVTVEHLKRGIAEINGAVENADPQNAAKSGTSVVQNAVKQSAAIFRKESQKIVATATI